MKIKRYIALPLTGFSAFVMLCAASAQSPLDVGPSDDVYTMDFDSRLSWCKAQADTDAVETYEMAMIWKSQGGGRRAVDCAAHALNLAGEAGLAAELTEELGDDITTGPPQMRSDYYAQSVDYWIAAYRPEDAMRVANAAYHITPDYVPTAIAKARAHGALGEWEQAEATVNFALGKSASSALLYIERAKARLKLDKLEAGLRDAETAMTLDFESVEAALIRGDIREAIRVKAEEAALEDLP